MSRKLPIGAVLLAAVLSSAALAAISLLITKAIAFDPEAWIVWVRELFGPGYLTTGGGPAWKPLPVLVIGPFTWISRGDADVYVWLLIARTGALLAVAGVAALAWRIAGRYAAAIAAVVVVASPWWFYNGILGNAEPLMVALIAGAVLAHDAGARRTAAVLVFAAALVRPEVWPFALVYGDGKGRMVPVGRSGRVHCGRAGRVGGAGAARIPAQPPSGPRPEGRRVPPRATPRFRFWPCSRTRSIS